MAQGLAHINQFILKIKGLVIVYDEIRAIHGRIFVQITQNYPLLSMIKFVFLPFTKLL